MDRNTSLFAVALVAASFGFTASADDPLREPGDPARWFIPAETPAQKFAVAMKEAGAALKEALEECRRAPVDRKACETQSRAQWRHDVRLARAHLSGEPVAFRQQ